MLARMQCCVLVRASLLPGWCRGQRDRLGCFSPAQASTCSGSKQFGSFAHALFGIFIKNGSYLAREGAKGKKTLGSEN